MINIVLLALVGPCSAAFVQVPTEGQALPRSLRLASAATDTVEPTSSTTTTSVQEKERAEQKKLLLGILNPEPTTDTVLADPVTKEAVVLKPTVGTLFATSSGRQTRPISYTLQAENSTTVYKGSSNTFLNLLEPVSEQDETSDSLSESNSQERQRRQEFWKNLVPLIPPPLRSPLATAGILVADDYVPMRDLFTSPSVSYAYERGWRQSFQRAGFPGEDEEARMAMDYFEPSMARSMDTQVLVDMSCATGLFTRRFAKSGKYQRVLGCDYSASMLQEARRRIQADPILGQGKDTSSSSCRLDLVRLDVGQIPMQTASVDALHAGAAMHCWPDLPAAASEIYRVLKPGGRYLATTFLSDYFRASNLSEGGSTGPSRQAFQYFGSVQQLRDLMEQGGFASNKINIEVLAPSCVVIRCEK